MKKRNTKKILIFNKVKISDLKTLRVLLGGSTDNGETGTTEATSSCDFTLISC
ncbi:hypothetical protein [Ascidiimonas sp. W6]|uniref:hypothetical protein n=1 Tax=Ascidiimonas meishanensis TaxID=3128903 RepID=UPI0030EEB78A